MVSFRTAAGEAAYSLLLRFLARSHSWFILFMVSKNSQFYWIFSHRCAKFVGCRPLVLVVVGKSAPARALFSCAAQTTTLL